MSNEQPKSTFNPWPYSIVGFFIIAIIGAVVWVSFCIGHSTDLVASDYYEQEVEYQNQLDRIERARELPGPASISYEAEQSRIRVQLPPEHAVLQPAGIIHLYRPSEASLDRTVGLKIEDDGGQLLDVSTLKPGLWDVRVQWTVNGQEYFLNRKFTVSRASS